MQHTWVDFYTNSNGYKCEQRLDFYNDHTGEDFTIIYYSDTSRFVCDNIYRVWKKHLQKQYDNVHTLVIMRDGGGSNSCSYHIVKQDLMKLMDKLNMNILMMHYPPYCSKFNPI